MSRLRRLAAIGLGLLVAGAVTFPLHGAAAQGESAGDGGWELDATITRNGGSVTVAGEITPPSETLVTTPRMKSLTVHVSPPSSGRCGGVSGSVPFDGEDDQAIVGGENPNYPAATTRSFSVDIVLPNCNGRYTATVTAVADRVGITDPDDFSDDDVTTDGPLVVDGEATVNEAPPNVAAIVSNLGPDRRITVGWQPPTGYGQATACSIPVSSQTPRDFLGYAVQRSIGDSAFTTVALPDPGQQCWIDTLTPTSTQGRYTYRVLARRAGADGEVIATAASAPTAFVTVGPPTSTPPPTATTVPFLPPAPARPAVASGTGTAGTVPPTITDDTFQETLDYGEEEPGELAAEVPDDADTFLDFVPSPGAGILVPFAIAECLAVWALHLRYLARRADDGV